MSYQRVLIVNDGGSFDSPVKVALNGSLDLEPLAAEIRRTNVLLQTIRDEAREHALDVQTSISTLRNDMITQLESVVVSLGAISAKVNLIQPDVTSIRQSNLQVVDSLADVKTLTDSFVNVSGSHQVLKPDGTFSAFSVPSLDSCMAYARLRMGTIASFDATGNGRISLDSYYFQRCGRTADSNGLMALQYQIVNLLQQIISKPSSTSILDSALVNYKGNTVKLRGKSSGVTIVDPIPNTDHDVAAIAARGLLNLGLASYYDNGLTFAKGEIQGDDLACFPVQI